MIQDPLDFEKTPALAALARKRRLAALSLFIEKAQRHAWRGASWVMAFCGLWLLQVPTMAGAFGPAAFAAIFLAGIVYLARTDLSKIRWPRGTEIDRRLEREGALPHRPLEILGDSLVNPKLTQTRALWTAARERAFAALPGLKVPLPRAAVAAHDPYALRMLAGLLLVIGIAVAGPDAQQRIAFGLFPFSFQQEAAQESPVTLWITPPEYTGQPQLTLQGGGRGHETVRIPQDSVIKIRVSDSLFAPVLQMGAAELPLQRLGEKGWGAETVAGPGERLLLKDWVFTRADIPYEYVIDAPPRLTIAGEPETMPRGEIRLPVKLSDDYGVTDMTLTMALDPMIEDSPLGAGFSETRAVMSAPAQETELRPVYDLSWHPWAGLPVVIRLEARDHKGQASDVIPLHVTLPERIFRHPVAQELVDYRKRLIWTPEEAARNVSDDLAGLLESPESFGYDTVVTLAIRAAAARLYHDNDPHAVARVVELLWDTALRIEDGNLPLAARNLQDAQRRLEQTLNDPSATDKDIAAAMQELREAMADYFQELFREMQKRMAQEGQPPPQIPPEMFQKMMDPEDLAAFLDRLQAEALSGDRDAARELMSQLQQFMDMLGATTEMAMPPEMEFMMEGINELQELIDKQQALRDQTQQQADAMTAGQVQQHYPAPIPFESPLPGLGDLPPPPQNNPGGATPVPAPAPTIDTQRNKVEQDALRYILGQLMLETDEMLGEIPENMGEAEQAMRRSATGLGENRPDLSLPHQDEALEKLQQAMQDMSQQLQQMMQNMTLLSLGGSQQFDPLGRPMRDGDEPGMFPGSRVKIPDEAERKRVQEILRLLRQRAGEVGRPDYELEYYRRLMKQF